MYISKKFFSFNSNCLFVHKINIEINIKFLNIESFVSSSYVYNVNRCLHLSPKTIKGVIVVISKYLFVSNFARLFKCTLFPSSFTFGTEELKCYESMITP